MPKIIITRHTSSRPLNNHILNLFQILQYPSLHVTFSLSWRNPRRHTCRRKSELPANTMGSNLRRKIHHPRINPAPQISRSLERPAQVSKQCERLQKKPQEWWKSPTRGGEGKCFWCTSSSTRAWELWEEAHRQLWVDCRPPLLHHHSCWCCCFFYFALTLLLSFASFGWVWLRSYKKQLVSQNQILSHTRFCRYYSKRTSGEVHWR